MKVEKQLNPIHYDADSFRDLLDRMRKYTDVKRFTGQAEWDGRDSKMEFDDPEELIESRSIPDRVRCFRLQMQGQEGRIRLDAIGIGGDDYHRLIINGDEEWVKKNLQAFNEFEQTQTQKFRLYFSNEVNNILQYALGGSAFLMGSPYLINLHPQFTFPIPDNVFIQIAFQLAVIGALEVTRRVFPYVVFVRNGAEPLYGKAISAISICLAIAGFLITIWQAV